MARIVVIGAGLGAMAAAARLAIAGHRVVVHERGATYGGALGEYARDGFRFDTGPGLLTLPAVYRDLFVKTGRAELEDRVVLEQVDPAARHVFADGTEFALPNASRGGVAQALDAALGAGTGARWTDFLGRAREAWDRTRRPLLEETQWPNWQILAAREPYPALPVRRLLRRERRATTLAEVGELELREPRLRALLESYALAAGLDAERVPASAAVLPFIEHTFGVWAVRGGLRALADAVHARCVERRVEFVFGSEVTRIVEKDGRAAGAELADGSVVEAEHVVAGVAPAVLARLLGGTAPWPADGVPPRTEGAARLLVLLALRGECPEGTVVRTVLHSPDAAAERAALAAGRLPDRPTVTVLRPDDPDRVPGAGHEAVTLTVTVPAGAEVPEGYVAELIDRVGAAVVPELRARLLWHETLTPAAAEEATGTPGGAVPAPALAAGGGRWLHPANSTALPGLHAVGGWSHPGGGLPHAGMSGALVAGLIVEGAGFTGST
ncbi:phytoene desaturase family protein [Streptomyces evansiae]|uniref:phytoene desaturase family protein n=1 Tax=Streptomyces evansiae TaxID=3075535 RepID=UPI002883C565|nr:NAD(P)/FAD-dependent oxidoreductase [Streptomyces sp. DSM 41859]MDT0420991.1 NAD(P)/FAD-dependent oxidoreductase [Streptomyces sp. DSM 41859]